MTAVLPEELTWMRQQARERMGSRAVILRATLVETETGERMDWLPTASVPCGVRDHTVGAETVLASRITSGSTVTVQLPIVNDDGAAVDVRAQDRLSVTVTDPVGLTVSTTVLEVSGVAGRLTEYPIVQRAVCQVLV
jgi:hypothetical protein